MGTLQPKVHRGRVFFRCDADGKTIHTKLLSQHEGFPYLQHDDNIDSWEMSVSIGRPAPKRDKVLKDAPDNRSNNKIRQRLLANRNFKRSKERWKLV